MALVLYYFFNMQKISNEDPEATFFTGKAEYVTVRCLILLLTILHFSYELF